MKTAWTELTTLSLTVENLRLHLATNYKTSSESDRINNEFSRKLDKINNLEIMLVQQEERRVATEKSLEGITQRLDVIYEEVVKNAKK
jgi:hypothetical protein